MSVVDITTLPERQADNLALARGFAELASENYIADHHLMPTMILLDAEMKGMLLVPNWEVLGEHPGDAMGMLLFVTARAMALDRFVTITEGWIKSAPIDTPDEELPKRGDLAKEAETNPDVHTTLMIHVWDPKDWNDGASVSMTELPFTGVNNEGEVASGLMLEPYEMIGAMQGQMLDTFQTVYEEAPPIEHQDRQMMVETFVRMKLCIHAALFGEDDE